MLIGRAPAAAAAWNTAARKSTSLRVASSAENSTSSASSTARATEAVVRARHSLRVRRSFFSRWTSLVAMNTWMRERRAAESAPPAASTSPVLARASRAVALGEPGHHPAELPAGLLARLLLLLRARRVQVRRAVAVLGDPAFGVRAVLDVLQDIAHLLAHARVDDPRADRVVAVLGGVAHRVAHVAEAAFIDEVDDELHLVHALEVRDLGLVARVDEGLPARLHELTDAAAEDDLLAEPVGLDLFLERRLDDAGARRAHALGVRERGLLGLARAVLVHREQRGDALALLADLAHAVARGLRRDHHDVRVGARLHLAEVDREGVRDEERAPLRHERGDLLVRVVVLLVGDEERDDVSVAGRVGGLADG